MRSISSVSTGRIAKLAAAAALVAGSIQAQAQVAPPQPPPQISVTGRGVVEIAPDRAKVQVGVETQAKTAAAAANENNRKQAAVLAAIRALGVPAAQISTWTASACRPGWTGPSANGTAAC